jgi:hypothetical protein
MDWLMCCDLLCSRRLHSYGSKRLQAGGWGSFASPAKPVPARHADAQRANGVLAIKRKRF